MFETWISVSRDKMDISPSEMDKKLEVKDLYRETLDEYIASYEEQESKIERFDKRIEEIAEQVSYHEKVKRLGCFLGIKTHTALSLIVETGDFERFVKGNTYAAYLDLPQVRIPVQITSTEQESQKQVTVI